ncbi:uncharacterized protein [Acropora muricata]|uniref:uncharacterized protein n=1 Tax=Acropora muricata TaxID=159855 RepID=UPI0034E5F6E4
MEASKGTKCKMTSKLAKESKDLTATVGSLLERIGDTTKPSNPYCKATQEPMSSTIKEWYLQLSVALKVESLPPKAIKSAFQDAIKLFGTNFDTKVTLRDAGHLGANEDIILRQFDPNFASTDVYCRHPSCGEKNPEAAKRGKRDLYLCPQHRKNLVTSIENALAIKKIDIPKNSEVPEKEQFTGYTSLIGLLDRAYQNSKKFGRFEEGKSTPMIEEAILNVRNVLIITSTVLNPDENNLALVLPYIIPILRLILENSNSAENLVPDYVYFLRQIIEKILFYFGVIYRWVSLALHSPGLQLGAGLGGTIGLGAGVFFGPWGAAAGMGAGVVLGGLIGNGIYNMVVGDPRQQEMNRSRPGGRGGPGAPDGQPHHQNVVHYFEGNEFGELILHPFAINEL